MKTTMFAAAAAGRSVAGLGEAPLHSYPDADIATGEKLLRDSGCTACHVRKVGGDGSAIYRPQGRIGDPASCAAWSILLDRAQPQPLPRGSHRDRRSAAARPLSLSGAAAGGK